MAGILKEGPIRKALRERNILKHSPEEFKQSLVGPDVSITFLDDRIHFIFHGGALESDKIVTKDRAAALLGPYIITLEKDLAILKEAYRKVP